MGRFGDDVASNKKVLGGVKIELEFLVALGGSGDHRCRCSTKILAGRAPGNLCPSSVRATCTDLVHL